MNEDKSIAEVREWMVKISTSQEHLRELLETNNLQTSQALNVAYQSRDIAKNADRDVLSLKKEFDNYKKEQRSKNKIIVTAGVSLFGSLIVIIIFLTPIVIGHYN